MFVVGGVFVFCLFVCFLLSVCTDVYVVFGLCVVLCIVFVCACLVLFVVCTFVALSVLFVGLLAVLVFFIT